MMNITLSLDLSNPKVAVFYGQLMKEVGKADIPVRYSESTETPKASAPKSTTKAVTTKASAKADATEPKSYATDYEITLEKDGIHINVGSRIGSKSSKIAASKLYGAGCKRGDNYNYYMVGKNGKMSASATKTVFEQFGGKIHIADEDYKWRA